MILALHNSSAESPFFIYRLAIQHSILAKC